MKSLFLALTLSWEIWRFERKALGLDKKDRVYEIKKMSDDPFKGAKFFKKMVSRTTPSKRRITTTIFTL